MNEAPTWEIKSLHQIELTSHCNLRCVYCTSPNLKRPKLDMDEKTFDRALAWVKYYVDLGTQGELNMAEIGESTMHPLLPEYLMRARAVIGNQRRLCFATNGILVTEELAKKIAPAQPSIWVSLHRPEKAKHAVDILREYGLLVGVSTSPALDAVDWARQVDWEVTSKMFGDACDWRRNGWVEVMADGRLTTCCFDSDGSGVIGHIDQEPGSVVSKPYRLCKDCHLDVGIEGWRDRVEGRVRV